MLMVKAEAYGLGMQQVATFVEDVVDSFGVVSLDEGVALRKAGISKNILVCACACDELKSAINYDLTIALHNFEQIDAIEALLLSGEIDGKNVCVHIKIDCEMHRLGFAPSDVDCVLKRLKNIRLECGKSTQTLKNNDIDVVGIYTHLRDKNFVNKVVFDACVQKIKSAFSNVVCHVASSHSLNNEALCYDGVRLGISAYKGCLRVVSQVIDARRIRSGERVSYGNFVAEQDMNTAVIFGGYADGIARENPSYAFIRSKPCKVLGNVCMDMFVVETGDFLPEIGEEVVLFDDDIARQIVQERNTIEYTLFTCWKGRIDRIYYGQKLCKTYCERESLKDDR